MSEHSPIISEEMLRALPSRVSHAAQVVLLTVGIGSTIISIAGEWSHGHHFLNQWLVENVGVLGAILNLLLIVLALFPGRIQPLNEEVEDEKVSALAGCINKYCLTAITWIWRFLGLFYVVLLYKSIAGHHARESVEMSGGVVWSTLLPDALIELFSAGNTLFFAVAYFCLTPAFLHKYGAPPDKGRKTRPHSRWTPWLSRRWVPLTFIVLTGIGVAVLHLSLYKLSDHDPNWADQMASLANGIVSAMALGYLVGRLDSKFISNWRWTIPPLFAYAGLQVYIIAIENPNEKTGALFIYSAFTLKCLLYIVLSNLFETRRILYYAAELMDLEDDRV